MEKLFYRKVFIPLKTVVVLFFLFLNLANVIAQGVTGVTPSSCNAGETISTTITLDASAMPPLPPSDVQPTSVSIGSISASSFNRTSTTSITASFDIPSGTISGDYDVSVVFVISSSITNTYTLSSGFEIIGVSASVYYVDGVGGNDSNDGLSWGNSKKTISSALSVANAIGAGEIWVKAGTYTPTTTTNREISFEVNSNVKLYGGFAGTETQLSERDFNTNLTVLSGDIGIASNFSDNSYHIIVTGKNAVVDGFSIIDGNANGDRLFRMGGAIYLADDVATIANCTISNNYAVEGGGMYIFNINGATSGTTNIVTIENCTFTNNSASNGGAIVLRVGASSNITNCEFSGNSADWRGGAIYIDYGAYESAPITISTCNFINNSTNGNGGAIYSDDMASQLTGTYWYVNSCTFTNNTATYRGGAVSNYNTANYPDFSNNNFSGNSSGAGGNAISNDGGVSITINNNTLESGQDIDLDSTSTCSGTDCP